MENYTNEPFRIAIDLDIMIALAKIDNPEYDPTGEVISALETRSLMPSKYIKLPKAEKPPLLQDCFLGHCNRDSANKDKYFDNLREMYTIYKAVLDGLVELYATPTVFFSFQN